MPLHISTSLSMACKLFHTVGVLLYLQLTTVHLNSAWQQKIVHILPDQIKNHNHTECSTNECYNLTELIQHRRVMRSNLKISFLPGTHTAQIHGIILYKINDVANVSLTAANRSNGATIIDCNNLLGFVFLSVTNLQIYGLTFDNCRGTLLSETSGHLTFAGVYIGKSENVSISYVTIQNGITGTGLFVELARGNVTISQSKFTHNRQNFCFLTEDLKETNISNPHYTNLTVTDSIFTHGKEIFQDDWYGIRTVQPGITLKLLKLGFTLLRNITVMDNYFSNLIIKFNVCTTNLTIENLFSSNCEDGLSLIVSTHCDLPVEVIMDGVVSVKNATFVNTRIFAESDSNIFYLPTGKWYRIVLENISVKGSHPREDKLSNSNPNEFRKVRLEMRNSMFKKTDGIWVQNSFVILNEQFLYEENSAGIVLLSESSCHSSSDHRARISLRRAKVVFRNNAMKNDYKSILYATDSTITMTMQTTMIFENNTGVVCGGMLLVKSNLKFTGSGEKVLNFSHNEGTIGGALALFDGSYLRFDCKFTKLSFIGNKASEKGGAVYVHDLGYMHVDYQRSQFIEKPFYIVSHCQSRPTFHSHFENNTARLGGNALYGGWLDSYQSSDPFSLLKNSKEDPSFVSSDPVRVCPCILSESLLIPDCNTTEIHPEIYPGQLLEWPFVAVGQRLGIVPSIAEIKISTDSNGEFDKIQYTQDVGLKCTTLTFRLRSSAKVEKIQLLSSVRDIHVNTRNGPVIWNPRMRSEQLGVTFLLKDCPLGFYFDHVEKRCLCQSALLQDGIQCNCTAFEVLRLSPKCYL